MTTPRPWALFAAVALAFLAAGAVGAEPRLFDLTLKDGLLPEGQRLLRVNQGDEVTLKWTTNRAFTLHLHGYDLAADVAPGQPARIRFRADDVGEFELELEERGVPIAELVVS